MKRASRTISRIDLHISLARWLAYVAVASGFLLIWLVDADRVTLSLSSPSAMIFLGGACFYALLATVLALGGWLYQILPVATLIADVVLLGTAYFLLGPAQDLVALAVDPFLFLLLLPIIAASVRFNWLAGVMAGALVSVMRSGLLLWDTPLQLNSGHLLVILFNLLILVGVGFLRGYLAETGTEASSHRPGGASRSDYDQMRKALKQANALQTMTRELNSTLNFERVLELALGVAERSMEEWGARGKLVSLVFLFADSGRLRLAMHRNLPRYEQERLIPGQAGIVAECLANAELVVSAEPHKDPELSAFSRVAECSVAVAIPMRAGFENYGAMVFATEAFPNYTDEQLELFSSIAGSATIALHNALLYQNLQSEKDRIVAVEEDARRKLSRDLHDGPTQGVSAIAMRLNFVRKMMTKQPDKMLAELETIEQMAHQTVKEIRHMLFTLRPLVLETQGLVAALRSLVEKVQDSTPMNIEIRDANDAASHLDSNQAGVLFYIVEEALGNARKYSQANQVLIRLWIEDNLFVAQVADDGVGFNTNEVLGKYESRGSLGMINMRERAELIEGSLKVKSTPGRGTAITVVVPLRRENMA